MTPVALPLFTVQEFAEAFVTHDSLVAGGDPTVQPITALVTFTPSVSEVVLTGTSPPVTVRLRPIVGRLGTDGVLRTINANPLYYQDGDDRHPVPAGTHPIYADDGVTPAYWIDDEGTHTENPDGTPVFGVRLVANSATLSGSIPGGVLDYQVTYSGVVFDSHDDLGVAPFSFHALTTDTVLDLGTVTRLPV